ncbi:hypothetical protein Pcinc_040388, partial [Petrolisthes cinctipes]
MKRINLVLEPGRGDRPIGCEKRRNVCELIECKHLIDECVAFPQVQSRSKNRIASILKVRAEDEDGGECGLVNYALTGDGVDSNPSRPAFSIHPTAGEVYMLKPLDRDPPEGQAKWKLRVMATDGEHNATTAVHVNLKDVNDNAPFFPETSVGTTLPENSPQGSSVALVVAQDNDDPGEGNNARLVYSLEKNVIDEASGKPIFSVDSNTGLVTTALCCLDREKTPKYTLQLVATDGGGLKGTGTVVVRVGDVNDVAPKFTQAAYQIAVGETDDTDRVLATLPIVDPDLTNKLAFRVVSGSGRGWEAFTVRAGKVSSSSTSDGGGKDGGGDPGGEVRATLPLDYENRDHRREFRFKVEVTDQVSSSVLVVYEEDQPGEGIKELIEVSDGLTEADDRQGEAGWGDRSRVDSAWVSLRVTDINDNPPVFTYAQNAQPLHAQTAHPPATVTDPARAHLTLSEDTPTPAHLVTFTAHDIDKNGGSTIRYAVDPASDPSGRFSVGGEGEVRVVRPLDRETARAHTVLVWALDDGDPPNTATATLHVTVTDVNDNPPFLKSPRQVTVVENSEGVSEVCRVTFGDPDDWGQGHGPPFTVELDARAPEHVRRLVSVTLDPAGDEGRGVGVVRTLGGLDREERGGEVLVPLVVGDAGRPPLSTTLTLTIVVADLNDNPMYPANKLVTAVILK